MDWILHFFSNLILFTAGIIVLLAWIIGLVLLGIEGRDLWVERKTEEDQNA